MRGFTLIELIIVMSIMVILSTVGFLNILNYKNRQELNSTSQEIIAVLRNAQDRALSQEVGGSIYHSGRWGVHFENPLSGSSFYSLFNSNMYNPYNPDDNHIVSNDVLPSNIQFDSPAPDSSVDIVFQPITGTANLFPFSDEVTIKISLISDPTVSSTITVNSNGKIRY